MYLRLLIEVWEKKQFPLTQLPSKGVKGQTTHDVSYILTHFLSPTAEQWQPRAKLSFLQLH